ncbi:hypothetical protein KNE206_68120 [Kitasatospora sp. NE20-6]
MTAGDGRDDVVVVVDRMTVTRFSLEELDAVAWDGLETNLSPDPAADVSRALRRLALAGAEATEKDCDPLYCLVTMIEGQTPSAAAAALPFIIALAADPAMGARVSLIRILAIMRAPALAGENWTDAWALLADPDPAVRRAAILLTGDVPLLLERCRVETDPTVRLPLLLALGDAVAADPEDHGAEEARAVLAAALDGDDPVLWVAAVHASAKLDPELLVRQLDQLIEVFCDPALCPRFEETWHTPAYGGTLTRENLVRLTGFLLGHDPDAQLSFARRLVESAQRTGDTPLCREALDLAWRLLTERRSVEAALLPLAGGLLHHPDGAVRLRAVNILAALGPVSAPYADRLAALLDDPGADELLDGTVGEFARWALTRVGDLRALPGLIAQLRAQEEQDRSYAYDEPRRPEVKDVLIPLRAHADVLLPAVRETIRQGGARGGATRAFIEVLEAWGGDALPALPDLLPLLTDTWTSGHVIAVLRALGPAAASAEPALPTVRLLDSPYNHGVVARTSAHISADREAALRFFGDAVMAEEDSWCGSVGALAGFGLDAAPYADQVRLAMENSTHWPRLDAAVTLWSITGLAEPSRQVLEEFVLLIADGGDGFGFFRDALEALIRIGGISPAARVALLTAQQSDRRLSGDEGYSTILQDEELRALIERALAYDRTPRGEKQ